MECLRLGLIWDGMTIPHALNELISPLMVSYPLLEYREGEDGLITWNAPKLLG